MSSKIDKERTQERVSNLRLSILDQATIIQLPKKYKVELYKHSPIAFITNKENGKRTVVPVVSLKDVKRALLELDV